MKRASFVSAVALCALTWAPSIAVSQSQDSGYRAYVDPQTGKLAPPPAEAPSAGTAAAGDEPLLVQPGKTDAGGVMVDFGNSHTYTLQATLNPDGKVTTDCIEEHGSR